MTYLLYGGPCHGQYVELPEGVTQLKVNHSPYQGLDGTAKYHVGFYVYRSSHSLQWQPEPH